MFYVKSSGSVRPYRVDVSVCTSFVDRLTGALVDGEIPYRSALLFPSCRSIHTFFMRSSIAVVMFDQTGKILLYRPRVRPFRVVRGPTETVGLLELAPNRLDAVDEDATEAKIFFPPSIAGESGFSQLGHGS